MISQPFAVDRWRHLVLSPYPGWTDTGCPPSRCPMGRTKRRCRGPQPTLDADPRAARRTGFYARLGRNSSALPTLNCSAARPVLREGEGETVVVGEVRECSRHFLEWRVLASHACLMMRSPSLAAAARAKGSTACPPERRETTQIKDVCDRLRIVRHAGETVGSGLCGSLVTKADVQALARGPWPRWCGPARPPRWPRWRRPFGSPSRWGGGRPR